MTHHEHMIMQRLLDMTTMDTGLLQVKYNIKGPVDQWIYRTIQQAKEILEG